jgi:uncharacterized protein YndB with AHSA1/START domain
MPPESRHLSVFIDRPATTVYRYVVDPAHLPDWAAGLSGSIRRVDDRWLAESPMGEVVVAFAPENDFGVLDHEVTLPSGEVVLNPMRVLPAGDGAEVVFTLRRAPGLDAAEFEADARAVGADLATLKRVLEA